MATHPGPPLDGLQSAETGQETAVFNKELDLFTLRAALHPSVTSAGVRGASTSSHRRQL